MERGSLVAKCSRGGIYKIVGMRTSRNVAAELAHTFSTRAGEIPASLREESRRKNEGEKERFLSIEREKRGERPWKIKSIKQGKGEDSSTQCSGTDQRFITSLESRVTHRKFYLQSLDFPLRSSTSWIDIAAIHESIRTNFILRVYTFRARVTH